MQDPCSPPGPDEAVPQSLDLPPVAGPLRLTDPRSIREAGLRLAAAADREILIFSHDLDPRLYDQIPFLAEVQRLALARPQLPVRLLVFEPLQALANAHRLIELGRKLGSRIGMRRVGEDFRRRTDAFLIADGTGYCLRHFADRHEALVEFHAPATATRLRAQFEQVWDLSDEDPELRRFTL